MAELQQKTMTIPAFMQRQIPLWNTPQWLNAERWRRVAYNQPIVMICQSTLISEVIASEWKIRSRDPKLEDKLAPEIEHYTKVFNPDMTSGIRGFDPWVSRGLQDMMTLPVGWNNELVRWPVNAGPFASPHPKGHVDKIVFIDGATLAPTYDPNLIMVQSIKQDMTRRVYFEDREIGRIIWQPRVELELSGYGMAPPEIIYLAVESLYRGDRYYANLLLDTPEAGILDLMDFDIDDMEKWATSQRELLTGVDPFKVPILWDHDKPANFIQFGRPPTELMFAEITSKYSKMVHAGFGLTLTDTGLGEQQSTLAGAIRDERTSMRSGRARVREAIKTFADEEVLPPDLEFVWVILDEEKRVQTGRAFVMFTNALKSMVESGVMNAEAAQAVLKKEGLIDEAIELPEILQMPPKSNGNGNGMIQNELDKVPANQGGEGDLTARGPAIGDPSISAAPTQAPAFDQLAVIIRQGFDEVLNEASNVRMMRLVKKATRLLYPQTQKAVIRLSQVDIPDYLEQRNLLWLGQENAFDEFPDVVKASQDVLNELDKTLESDKWWELPDKIAESIAIVLGAAYSQGATLAAEQAWQFLYTEGIVNTPNVQLAFNLSNPATLKQLEDKAALLVKRVNDGTKFYLKRVITSGVEEGLSSPNIAQMVKDGVDVEAVLRESGYSEQTINRAKMELEQMTDNRVNSIVNTEVARAETDGRLGQWDQMGLTKKRSVHTGPDTPCPVCTGNQDLDFVEMDYMFDSVFGSADTPGPPYHPQVCHCHIEFDEAELMGRGDELQLWDGS